jgi:hypothetical protein
MGQESTQGWIAVRFGETMKVKPAKQEIPGTTSYTETNGHAIFDDEWTVKCVNCENVLHYRGFFDPDDPCECDNCHAKFKCRRIYFDDQSYIG